MDSERNGWKPRRGRQQASPIVVALHKSIPVGSHFLFTNKWAGGVGTRVGPIAGEKEATTAQTPRGKNGLRDMIMSRQSNLASRAARTPLARTE